MPGMTPRRIAGVIVAAVLAWRVVASIAGAQLELFGRDNNGRTLGQRFAAIEEPIEARWHRSLGYTERFLRSVRTHVPGESILALFGADTRRNRIVLDVLITMVWPRRVVLLVDLPEGALESGFAYGRPLYVLTLDAEGPFPQQDRFDQVDGSRRFGVWRHRDPALDLDMKGKGFPPR